MANSALQTLLADSSIGLPDGDLLLLMRSAIIEQQHNYLRLERRMTEAEERMTIDDESDREMGKLFEGVVEEITSHEKRITTIETTAGNSQHTPAIDARLKLLEKQIRMRTLHSSARLGEEGPKGIPHGRVPLNARASMDSQDGSVIIPPPATR